MSRPVTGWFTFSPWKDLFFSQQRMKTSIINFRRWREKVHFLHEVDIVCRASCNSRINLVRIYCAAHVSPLIKGGSLFIINCMPLTLKNMLKYVVLWQLKMSCNVVCWNDYDDVDAGLFRLVSSRNLKHGIFWHHWWTWIMRVSITKRYEMKNIVHREVKHEKLAFHALIAG